MNTVGGGVEYKAKTKSWKQRIAKAVGEKRKGVQDPKMLYAISVTMHFHPATHGNRELDAEDLSIILRVLDQINAPTEGFLEYAQGKGAVLNAGLQKSAFDM